MPNGTPSETSRRAWLKLAALTTAAWAVPARGALAQGTASSTREDRIRRVIAEYEEQGFHRTATPVDNASARWLSDQVRRSGLSGSLEPFRIQRVDPLSTARIVGDRRLEGLPLFDGGFTGAQGIRGRLGPLDGDAEIGLVESLPNAAAAGALGDARQKNRHQAIICITRGGRPGLCASNADAFLRPFGPPVLQVSSEHASWLQEQAQRSAAVQVVVHVTRTSADAFNVTAKMSGADATLPSLVIMTPRSGWYWCASERGGGLACWLELIRALSRAKLARDVIFVASSGHELGHLGINAFVDRRPRIVSNSVAWLHLGANIGAARNAKGPLPQPGAGTASPPSAMPAQAGGNTVQASDDRIDGMLTEAMTSTGLTVDGRMPRARVPAGEAEVVHRGGGRYVSVIASSAMFHNPADRGPDVIDARTIGAFAAAFIVVATRLADREPFRY
jgi:hypothetical protein